MLLCHVCAEAGGGEEPLHGTLATMPRRDVDADWVAPG